ncbi:MAG TPA: prepilin-type N-terminal cleavage/methylation domain-containing protein, partial [Candidatus Paceibacterota bacterium]
MIKTRGFTLAELLVYAAIMGFVLIFVIGGMISLNHSVIASRASRDVNISAATALERMVRELKDADSVLETGSTLGVSPGVLTIATDNASTTGGTMKFSLSGGQVMLTTNSTSSLSASNVSVSRLVFYLATSTHSLAVR